MERSSTGEGVREQSAERDCASQRDHSVAEQSKLVHPIGTPINHATHIGFRLPPAHVAKPSPLVGLEPLRLWFPLTVGVGINTALGKFGLFLSRSAGCPPLRQSRAAGVGHCLTALGSIRSPLRPLWFGPPFAPSVARGVGQNCTVVRRFIPPSLPLCPGPPVPSDLVGVGKTTEHPPPISLMRCANV